MTPALHVREQMSMLAALEKRALVWMARRLPQRVTSDHLTILSLVSMAAAGLSAAAFQLTPWAAGAAIACLVANWFGDSLDGTVARVRDQQRPRYGYYVDHVIDLAGITLLATGLACSGLMSPLIALGLLASYLLVSAESYLATHATGVFRISFLGFGPTELRIVLGIGFLKAAQTPFVTIGGLESVRLFDLGGVVAMTGLAAVFVASAVRNTRALFVAEPIPEASLQGGQ
jgi:phosphatidylglycerophosphate synthase